jgi:oligopeptide/dipeptide ABC transporter ATP-binding protein
MEDPILRIDNLKKHFRGSSSFLGGKAPSIKALDGVSFEVAKSDTFGLVGESGCGKSTLGKTILGIYRPTQGTVFFEGRSITHLPKKDLIKVRKDIQYVYQNPGSSLDPRWKVKRILSEPLLIHTSIGSRAAGKKAEEMMEAVGLTREQLSLYPHEFSGGQQRRLGLARILALNPSVVILDEPTSGLDVSVQATILKLFTGLKARFNLTYVFISHNLSVVQMMCRRVAVMYGGKIVEIGETARLYAEPLHPYTKALIAAIPMVGKRKEEGPPVIGEPPNPADFPSGCRFWPRCSSKADRCIIEDPPLVMVGDGRLVSCHLLSPSRP